MREPTRNTAATHKALIDSLPATRQNEISDDKFALRPEDMVPGVTREWKRYSVAGQVDHAHQSMLRQAGWVPVTTEQLPHWMPPGTDGGAPIEREGMMLYQRRAELTQQARAAELRTAQFQKNQKARQMNETPAGTMDRTGARLGREVLPIPGTGTSAEPL